MKVLFKYCFVALAGLVGLSLASCSDDDKDNSAKSVLASVSSLSYEAKDAPARTFRVVSDAQWTVDAPEWITVDPATGSGDITVSVAVKDNYEGDVMQLPRRETIVFHGATHASRCEILVIQEGDPFLTATPIAAAELKSLADDASAVVKNLTVVDLLSDGFMATDGTTNVQVVASAKPAVGSTVTAYGYKKTDRGSMAYVELDHVVEGGTAASLPAAEDITAKMDSYKNDNRALVAIDGIYDASGAIVVEGATAKANVVAAVEGIDMKALSGHKVAVEAYYGGAVNSGMNVIVRKVEDKGLDEVVYYFEDFEWLEPWTSQKPAGDTVGENNSDATAQQLGTNKVDGVSTYDALLAKGYEFPITCHSSKSPRQPQAQVYLQRNYLKFGLTDYYSGITLPKFDVPEGTHTTLSFSWSVQRAGNSETATYDPTQLVVIVSENGSEKARFDVPPHDLKTGEPYRWIQASIDLGTAVTSETRITIRNVDSQWPASDAKVKCRYHLDNIKIAQVK